MFTLSLKRFISLLRQAFSPCPPPPPVSIHPTLKVTSSDRQTDTLQSRGHNTRSGPSPSPTCGPAGCHSSGLTAAVRPELPGSARGEIKVSRERGFTLHCFLSSLSHTLSSNYISSLVLSLFHFIHFSTLSSLSANVYSACLGKRTTANIT